MFRITLPVIIFLFVKNISYSQQKEQAPPYSVFYTQAEKLYNRVKASPKTDSLALADYRQAAALLTDEKKYIDILTDCYLKAGILEMSRNNLDLSLRYFHLAIYSVGKNNLLSDTLIFKPCLYAGTIHYNLNNLDSAVFYYKKSEGILSVHKGLNESERLYNKFGALYFETGDYNKSISYFEKALSIVEEKKPLNEFFAINYKNNIATALMKLGRYDPALEIFKELQKYPQPADALNYNIGNTFFEKKDYASALLFLRRIRNLDLEKYITLTKVFIRVQQYDSARFYLLRAKKQLGNQLTDRFRLEQGIILKYSGDLELADGNTQLALANYQRAINRLDPAFSDSSVKSNPSSFSGLQNFLFLFDAIVAKAAAWNSLYKQHPDINNLEQSKNTYAAALSLVKHIEKTYFSDDARLFLKNKVNPATQDAVAVAIRLFDLTKNKEYLNDAFSFAENNKATVLQAGLKNMELTSIPGLPLNLVKEEKSVRILLAKLFIQAGKPKDSLSARYLQTKIHDSEVSLATIQDKLDENSVYHKIKFTPSFLSINQIQNHIQCNDEAILAYYYTKTTLVCFYITKQDAGFYSVPLQENIFYRIKQLRNELQSPESSSRKVLQEMASGLYQDLIDPVFEKIKNKKRLLIIPYNELSYLPFEILVNPRDGSLLLHQFAISYNYSSNFLADKSQNKLANYQVLGLAPFSVSGNAHLIMPVLPASREEIENLPGKKLFAEDATKDRFVALSGQYPVIHLATHAIANDTNLLGSYIEFYGLKNEADSGHRLYEQEIYYLDMKSARLVILSACETGSGLLVNGEGVMSLSRAFSYAGCKSVITTLWKADEISTSFITKRLHHYLGNGMAIDMALQKAKLDYLSSNEIPDRFKNPAYWAHLVLIGDSQPVIETPVHWVWWIALFLCVVLLVFLFGKK